MLLVLGAWWWSAGTAQAQIVAEKPAKIKAANRRALREAHRTDSPYKDSHLGVTRERLKRGESTQPLPEGSDELHYKNGVAPNVKPPGILGLRRKNNLQRPPSRATRTEKE